MKSDFMMAINQVCHERQLAVDIVLEAVEVALISAYKKNFSGNHVTALIEAQSGEPQIFIEKAVVDTVEDEQNEILLKDALKINPLVEIGGLVSIENTPTDFGRIAAQTAKQVILQRIREAERDALYNTYVEREGEIVNGTVHKVDPHQVTLSLGKVEAYLPRNEQIPTERYSEGQRLRAYVANVNKGSRGPQIIVSRTHRNMLRRLLEVEVPEIYNGTVEIKSIAREAGYRSKVAVAALQEGVDPVGSCVGMRGTRIQNIVNELNGEKIDVVQWNPDLSFFIANSLSPAKVMNVMLDDINGKTAAVVVPDKQLSLAIGKEGQNARLAAKLTNWRIDIKSASEAIKETLVVAKEDEAIRERIGDRTESFEKAAIIVAEKEPIDYTEAELNIFSEAIEIVNLVRMAISNERRVQAAEAKKAAAADDAIDILSEAEALLSAGDLLPTAEIEEGVEAPVEQAVTDADDIKIDKEELVSDLVAEAEALLAEIETTDEVQEESEVEAEIEPAAEAEVEIKEEVKEPELTTEPPMFEDGWDDGLSELEKEREKKKAREKRRRLVFDERLGEVVSERRHKKQRSGGGRIEDWLEDYDEEDF